MTGCQCCAAGEQFDARIAARDLRRFRRRGPDPATRQLLDAVQDARPPLEATLLDIGGGIGAIHHVLLDRGIASATHIDASTAYLAQAALEAERRGHGGRVSFRHGEFRAVAGSLLPADVVTLDRVVCCDPDYGSLLAVAAEHARMLLALTYPRPRWLVRVTVVIGNAIRRLRGQAFRAYVHPPSAMTAVLEGQGLRRRWAGGTWVWAAEIYERSA